MLQERQEIQALFYTGARAFEDGDVLETKRLWQQVKAPVNPLGELECYLLTHERERLKGQRLHLNSPQPLLQQPKRLQQLRPIRRRVMRRQISPVRTRQHCGQFLQREQVRVKRIDE